MVLLPPDSIVVLPPDPIVVPPSLASFPAFHHPDIDCSVQDRGAARRTLNAAFTVHLDAYLEAAYGDLEQKPRVFRHYEWTARFQFNQESAQVIADDVGVGKASVQEAVATVARAIGLSLRTEEPEGKLRPGPKK